MIQRALEDAESEEYSTHSESESDDYDSEPESESEDFTDHF